MEKICFLACYIRMEITDNIIKKHGLSPEEYKRIQNLMKRNPNLLELGIFLQCGMNIAHINHRKCI